MANLNPLPDLSTVDIQAIQDSGPVHPCISLPPLTTIAENWDSVEPSSRNLTTNGESCSEDDEDDSEEEEQSITPGGKVQDRHSHRTSCTSSSSAPDSGTDSSGSELSDATSDSAESSTSSSDSDSDSQSSASSASSQSKIKSRIQHSAAHRGKTSFSVREANYDKGRVTLRLSTLQLGKKQDITDNPLNRSTKISKTENSATTNEASFQPRDSDNITACANRLHGPLNNSKAKNNGNQKPSTPVKRTRPSRLRPSPEPLKIEPSSLNHQRLERNNLAKSTPQPNQKTQERNRGKIRRESVCNKSQEPSSADPAVKKDGNQAIAPAVKTLPIPSSSQSTTVTIGSSLIDLDSDSDELHLPAVSEAIRMLDLDSQGSPFNENPIGPTHSALSTYPRLPISLVPTGNIWPTIGCCSSLLQQFVAKSQSGEPPPPPSTLMLPTKGARKCFPPNDEPLPAADSRSVKRAIDVARVSSFASVMTTSAGVADQELDMMVPMRGLDCHPSHVSPDSGIQSVSGSPFSVHSSPVHPSGAGCSNNQTGGQTQTLVVSPCPPSPPLRQKPTSKKSGESKKSTKSQRPTETTHKVKNGRQNSSSRSRRPRSCRDTASALSSGLGKDSSIAQAIQRGMNAALRLKNNKDNVRAEEDESHSQNEAAPPPTLVKSSRTKKSSKRQLKSAIDQTTAIQVVEKDFRNEVQTNSLAAKNISEHEVSQNMILQQPKLLGELKLTLAARSPSPHRKRKKKRKKVKSSSHEHVPSIPMDPNLQSALDQLCKRLDRCVISRSITQSGHASCDKLPWVFQCRKYTIANGNNTSSNNNRAKRKKMLEEASSVVAKRKGKSKKTGSQPVPVSEASNVEATRENEPTVAAAAAAVLLTAVELLLPLKKRHHHLATSEVVDSVTTDNSATEKPSQEHAVAKVAVQQQQQSNRKRAANSESTTETAESVATDQAKPQIATNNQKSKKGRSQKKAKTEEIVDIIAAVAAGAEEPLPIIDNVPVTETSTPVQAENCATTSDQLAKKKNRRRKTFNRTGFPSVKKKRKKPSSPIPPTPPLPPPAPKDEVDDSLGNNTTSRQAKRAKIMPKDEDEDGLLPEPTSSEAPSGDESVLSRPSTITTTKDVQPKKRRMSSMRKRYLPAGLLSNYFKEDSETSSASTSAPTDRTKVLTYEPEEHEHGLLPPPFYCERFLRRTKRDFQLPFDVWWLHQQGKLPGRDNLVPSWNYRKIRSNVYYDVKPPFTNDAQACNCTLPPVADNSTDAEAQCCGDDCLNRMVYTECSSQLCPVGDKCMNQRIQRHRWAQGLERFMTKEKGWGVRCRNPLKSGVFILEYVGEVVSDKEFKERMHTVYVHDTHHYCLHLDGGLVIDGHRMGGDGRFVNHSCAPNCEMQKWSVNGLPRMALFALRDISPMEELSYDYNFSLFNPAEGQPCKCGSPQCRGVIGGKSQRINVIQDAAGSKIPQKLSLQKRKRKTQLQGKTSLAMCSSSINLRPLSTQQRAFVLQHRCFLLRNLDKVRDWRDRQKDRIKLAKQQHQMVGRTRRFISRPNMDQLEKDVAIRENPPVDANKPQESAAADLQMLTTTDETNCNGEEIVRCRCRQFDDEGLMVQCERCETWQHGDCLGPEKAKAALDDEHYICESCAGIPLCRDDLKIVLVPQPDSSHEGHTYYLSLYYKDLHLRQGDCVYVLRDHDTPESEKTLWSGINETDPVPRPPHHLPAHIKLANLDIFQIEKMWTDENGKPFVYGHHFFRPQDTYHEPSRKFFVNEVLHSPIYEAIPIWAVAGRCWVLDLTTFCKGRPIDAVEEHVYICEYRIDRTARLFSKNARTKFPICTRRFAFKSFVTRLKPQRTFQPHGAPPANNRKSTESPAGSKQLVKSEKSGKEKAKKAKQETTTQQKPTLPISATPVQLQLKVQERKFRLDKLLRHLLIKKTPEGSQVEDATHLLHRGRGRMRGRPSKQKSLSNTSS